MEVLEIFDPKALPKKLPCEVEPSLFCESKLKKKNRHIKLTFIPPRVRFWVFTIYTENQTLWWENLVHVILYGKFMKLGDSRF